MARNTKGAGLGLYLTRSIIEAHGGHIWVDPESGKGARICFSLPSIQTYNPQVCQWYNHSQTFPKRKSA